VIEWLISTKSSKEGIGIAEIVISKILHIEIGVRIVEPVNDYYKYYYQYRYIIISISIIIIILCYSQI